MPIIIGNMKALNIAHDELWFVMRSMDWFYKNKDGSLNERNYKLLMNPYTKIVEDLSPSQELFFRYLSMKKRNSWNSSSFESKYLPQFIFELIENEEAKDRLNQLWELDRQNKTVLLICSCAEESLCHRSILAGILYGVGCRVYSNLGTDISTYGRFYDLYRQREKQITALNERSKENPIDKLPWD